MSTPKIHVANDQAFQICPEWVLMAPVSAQAIRLYLVLRKFGDNTTEESYWSRTNIASAMHLKSPRSVDQYVKELVDIGALKVRPRFEGNRQTSNWYKVITADPKQYSARVAESCTPGGEDLFTPEVAESCSQSQNLDEPRTSTVSPGAAAADAQNLEAPWDVIARTAYDSTDGALNYMGMRGIAKWALEKKECTPAEVEAAIASLWRAGRAVNKQTVGQYLEGITSTYGKPAPKERVASTAAIGERLQAEADRRAVSA